MGNDRVPALGEATIYSDWKRRVCMWQKASTIAPKHHAPILITHMSGEPERIAIMLDEAKLAVDKGVEFLITELDAQFAQDSTLKYHDAVSDFIKYVRPAGMSIEEYCREFNHRLRRLREASTIEDGKDLMDSTLLGYFLLENSGISDDQKLLMRSHTTDQTKDEVEKSLRKLFGKKQIQLDQELQCEGSSNKSPQMLTFTPAAVPKIKEEPIFYSKKSSSDTEYSGECSSRSRHTTSEEESEEATAYYSSRGGGYHHNRGRGSYNQRGTSRGRYEKKDFWGKGKYPNRGRNQSYQYKPKNIECYVCGVVGHMARDCSQKKSSTQDRSYFQSFVNICQDDCLRETYKGALLDSGASATVCGKLWLETFEESLTDKQKSDMVTEKCFQTFRFGDGAPTIATVRKNLPVTLCGEKIGIWTFVVENDVPLLLARATMKKMGCKIDFNKDELCVFGKREKLIITGSGHMIVPFGNRREPLETKVVKDDNPELTFLSFENSENPKKCAQHLHRYFAHASCSKIKEVVMKSKSSMKEEICKNLEEIEHSCDHCLKRKSRQIPHRKTALPPGKHFNDRVAMDLKQLSTGEIILHVIDTVTRYTAATQVKNKTAEEIITKIFRSWIAIFGRPAEFLTDNGGEFVNQSFNEMCQLYDIRICTSPAESPWSNGVVERHNAILGKMIESVREETGCNLETAICWSVSSKNSLNNVQGFSPNQLIFGQNPVFPGLLEDQINLTTLNTETTCKLIADNNNARTAARKAFIMLENDNCMKRAMKERVFQGRDKEYKTGDQVYFKREKSKIWDGPARIVGQLDNVVIIKHGGLLYRMNPCKIVMKTEADTQISGVLNKVSENEEKEDTTRMVTEENEPIPHYSQICESDSEVELLTETSNPSGVQRPLENQSPMGDKRLSGEQSLTEDQRLMTPVETLVTSDDLSGNEDVLAEPETTEVELNEDDEMPQWNSVEKNGGKIQLKKDDTIRFRPENEEDWTNALVVSRAGKATATKKNSFNVFIPEEDTPVSIDLNEMIVEKQSEASIFHVISDDLTNPDITKAKEEEIKKFKEFGVFEEVQDTGQTAITCRWVITSKGDKVHKARCVARGFQEVEVPQSDAPTVNKISKRLMFAIAVCNKWEIKALDITSAFLQADKIDRDLYVEPPKDIRRRGILWKLNKPLYGLGDSARKWYFTLRRTLLEAGCVVSQLDNSIFNYFDDKNQIAGIVVTHVDDLLYAGNAKFYKEVIRKITTCFKISKMNSKDFSYLGWSIKQQGDAITVDQREYCEKIQPVSMDRRNKDLERPLTSREKGLYQETLGKLLWISSQTRPDLSFDTMELSTYTSSVKVKHMDILNKVVKKVKFGPREMKFNRMDLEKDRIKVIFYSDASLGNLPNKAHSGRGYLVFLSDGHQASLIAWSSNKIKRVVHSVYGAETLGCVDGMSAAIYIRQLLSEMLYNDARKKVIPIYGFIDSNQLFQSISSVKQPLDMRMRLDIAGIRETVSSGEVDNITWIPTREMLADSLTKKNSDIKKLKDVVENGHF